MSQANHASVNMPKVNIAFASLLLISSAYFVYWGLGYTHYNNVLLFLLATLFGLFMAFNIGGNDVANSFGTSVGAGTLSVSQALLIAAVFEVSGAVIAGGEVTETIRNGIVDFNAFPLQPIHLILVMMSALLAAALWLLFASKKGLPVSTTHAIVGGIVGSAIFLGYLVAPEHANPWQMVQWNKIGTIALSWVVSPLLGGVASYLVYSFIKTHILDYNNRVDAQFKAVKAEKKSYKEAHKAYLKTLANEEKIKVLEAINHDAQLYADSDFDPKELTTDYYKGLHDIDTRKKQINTFRALISLVPAVAAVAVTITSSMLIFKGLKNLHLNLNPIVGTVLVLFLGAVAWLMVFIYANSLKRKDLNKSTLLMFSWLQVFTAAGFAFSHGANDISNAIGPFAAIMDIIRTNDASASAPIPPVAMLVFGISLIVGLWFIGKEVIHTVGTNLSELHPASGFSAELSAGAVVMVATLFGLPVSSTHILVGAVLGIGLVNRNANWKMMKPIGLAWIVTLPAASFLSLMAFGVLYSIFA